MSTIPSEEDFLNEIMTDEDQAALAAPDPEPITEDDEPGPVVSDPVVPAAEPKMVDVRALQEARAAERQVREEYAREREARVRLEERTNFLLQRFQPQQPAAPEPPKEDEDIVGFLKHEVTTAKQEAAALKAAFEQQQQAQQQQQQVQYIVDQADQVYEVARTKHPDVNDAFQFAVEATKRDIAAKGYSGAQAEAAFQQVLFEYAARCPPDPDQAAEYIRRSARWWGWAGPQQVAQGQRVADLATRTERHMSLSGVAGGEAPAALDARAIANMSDEEFFKLADRLSEKELDKLMGAA